MSNQYDDFQTIEGLQAKKWRDRMSDNYGMQKRLNVKAKQNFQKHMQSLQSVKPDKQKDTNFLKLLKLDQDGIEQDARRRQLALELMNIKGSDDVVKDIITDRAPKDTKHPLYAAYAFDIEYLSPLLKTLNERVQKLNSANDYLQRDLNIISQYLNISINENRQLRNNIVKRDKTMEQVLDTINDETLQKINAYDRKIQLLSEENNILISQRQNYKVYKDKFDLIQEKKNEELEKAADVNDNLQKVNEELQERYQEIADKYALMEIKCQEIQERINSQELEHADCKLTNEQLEQDSMELVTENQKLKQESRELEDRLRSDLKKYQAQNVSYSKQLKDQKDILHLRQNQFDKANYENENTQKRMTEVLSQFDKIKNSNQFLLDQNNAMKDQILLLENEKEQRDKKLQYLINTNENLDISHKNALVENQRLQEQHKNSLQALSNQHLQEAEFWQSEKDNLQNILNQQQIENRQHIAIRQQYEALMLEGESLPQFQQRMINNNEELKRLRQMEEMYLMLQGQQNQLKQQNIKLSTLNYALEEEQNGIKMENQQIIEKLNELSNLEEENVGVNKDFKTLRQQLLDAENKLAASDELQKAQQLQNQRLQQDLVRLTQQLNVVQAEMRNIKPQQDANAIVQIKNHKRMIAELEGELEEVDNKNETLIKEKATLQQRMVVLEGLCQKMMRSDPRYANQTLTPQV